VAERTLAEEARELYRLPPAEFVAARNARRAELRASDRELAEAIGELRRPSPAAWLVSRLAEEEPDRIDALVELGDSLRAALANADREALAHLTEQRRDALREVSDAAARIAGEHEVSASRAVLDDVAETLQAAMGDAAAAAAVRSGLLVRALESSGFDPVDLAGAVAVDGEAPPAPRRPRLRAVKDADAELARARAEAAEALDEARSGLADAERALDEHDERTREAREHHDELAAEVERLEAEFSRARRRRDDAASEVRELTGSRGRLTRELERAQDAVARAEERRDRFT